VDSPNTARENQGWKVISSQTHFANANLKVATEEIRSPARTTTRSWTVVHRKAAVVIAPMTRDGKMILIRQERIPIRTAIWEMPAGQIDDATDQDEAAVKAVALRELREETGFDLASDGELTPLGHFFSSPGFTDERGYFFLACPVEQSADGHARQESESILDCRSFDAAEIKRMISENEIRDANTLSLWARLVARGFVSFTPPPATPPAGRRLQSR
jgi:ADP-ribose diphosphatase